MFRSVFSSQTRALFLALCSPCVLSACGVADTAPDLPGVVSGDDDLQIGKVTSALDGSVCSTLKSVASFLFNGAVFNLDQLECGNDTFTNTYFNGSEALANNLTDLDILPFVQQGAYFCGIADADGAHADAVLGGLGGFGVQSDFNVTERNAQAAHVKARRTGSLVLFGVPAKLEAQDITFDLPVEKTSNNSMYGGYMTVNGDGAVWNFKGRVQFPIGNVLITLAPAVHTRSPTQTMSNGGIKFVHTPPPGVTMANFPNQLDSGFFFSNWVGCGTLSNLCPVSHVDQATFIQEHTATCPADVASLTDHVLPYSGPWGGASCKTQNFIFFDMLDNWFHFGRPNGSVVSSVRGPTEPSNNITVTAPASDTDPNFENNATMWTSLEIGANY